MFLSALTSLNSTAQTFLEREKGKNNVSFHLTSPNEVSMLPMQWKSVRPHFTKPYLRPGPSQPKIMSYTLCMNSVKYHSLKNLLHTSYKKLNLNNKTCWPAISSLFRCCRHGGSQIEKDEKQRHFVDFAWYTEGSWYQLVVCMVYAIYCQLWRSLYPKRPQDTRKSGNFVNFSFIFHEYFRCEFFS